MGSGRNLPDRISPRGSTTHFFMQLHFQQGRPGTMLVWHRGDLAKHRSSSDRRGGREALHGLPLQTHFQQPQHHSRPQNICEIKYLGSTSWLTSLSQPLHLGIIAKASEDAPEVDEADDFFCTWTKSGPWSPWRLHCVLSRPDLSPGIPPWDVCERSRNAI